MSFNFDEIKQKLEEQLQKGEVNYESFKEAVNAHKRLSLELQGLVEYACKIAERQSKENFERLYTLLASKNASDLCDGLRREGEKLRSRSELHERFYDVNKGSPKSIVFRILELTRLGKKSDVFHILLREFLNAKESMSQNLMNAFKPVYSDEMFKVFIYSFLSGLLGQKASKGEDQE